MSYLELTRLAGAEIVVVLTALMVLALSMGGEGARRWLGWVAAGGCGTAAVWLLGVAPEGSAVGGMLVSDALTRWVKVAILGLTLGTVLLSGRVGFTPHAGEFLAIVLLGAVGMLLVAGAENVLLMFLALELASLSLYILTAFDKRSAAGAEAALKYFLFGGMAGAFLLFGLSLIYGVTGAIEFRGIGAALARGPGSPLLLVGMVMVLAGLGFKVAAAPFHFWAPDAYQGAPAPAAGFIAAGSKVAAFFVLAKFCVAGLGTGVAGGSGWGGFASGWSPVVATLAVASMVWGNLAALAQRNVRRLLAYSAIAQAGYTLVALAGEGPGGLAAILFYATTYAITALGAFGVVGLVEERVGGSDFEHFAGLGRRSPGLAISLAVFVLSLAGIPPLAGFFGKFYLFLAALGGDGASLGMLWLVALGAATTCVSFYYYLRLLKVVFIEESNLPVGAEAGSLLEGGVVGLTAILVIVAGCAPDLLLASLLEALVTVGL